MNTPATSASVTAVAPTINDPWIGRRLKKYAIIARIGQGGMGVVYLAEDTMLRRTVALKMVSPEHPGGADGVRRFMREAQSAAKLQHANVASIYDIDEDQGTYFFVMEYVPGPSAQQIVEKAGPLPWRQATHIIAEACRGLVAAHAARLIHRDIKPGNILVASSGQVKLGDFGLAKRVTEKQTAITIANQVLGTPHYMSPEQGQNDMLDERSDIYSLGATFYALLTGEPPYPGKDAFATVYAHRSLPIPDPRAKVADIPEACVAIINKAMAKRRGDRYHDAQAMLTDLEAALGAERPSLTALTQGYAMPHSDHSTSITTPNVRQARSVNWSAIAAIAIVGCILGAALLVCGGATLFFIFRPVPADPTPEQLAQELVKRNPIFNGKLDRADLQNNRIVRLKLGTEGVSDISPLAQLTELEELDLSCPDGKQSNLKDISFLAKLKKLKKLRVHGCLVDDIDCLKELKSLTYLDIGGTKVKSLEALRRVPLKRLNVAATAIVDFRGLEETQIEKIQANFTYGLKSLTGLPIKTLTSLSIESTLVDSFDPIKGAPKFEYFNFKWAKVTSDERPKKGQPAERSLSKRDWDTLLALPSLHTAVGEFTSGEEEQLKKHRNGFRALRDTPNESF